jgi:AraC-like DNA-binding protein
LNYQQFISELPPHATITFTSPEANEEVMRRMGVNQVIRQLERGSFRGDMALRSTEQGDLVSDRFNKGISVILEPPAANIAFIFPICGTGKFLASGEDAANDKLLFLPDGSEAEITTLGLAGSDSIVIPQEKFVEMAEILCPTFHKPERATVFKGDKVKLRALRKMVVDLVARQDPGADAEQMSNLLEQTVTWMGCSSGQPSPERLLINGAEASVAKKAQEFIEDHYKETVRLLDICRVTEVGIRTVQRSFREYFGITITEYLKILRLDKCRRELIKTDPSHDTVTRIALEHGFSHLGRFSIEFQKRFGQNPSKVLKKQ